MGTVIDQVPDPGTQLAPDCPVNLTVAKPIPLVEVPDFVGSTLAEVEKTASRIALAVLGIQVGRVSHVVSAQHPEGTILGQQPKAGSRVRKGTSVDLVVSRRPPQTHDTRIVVPDLRGQPKDQAVGLLREMGLRPTFHQRACGSVLRQAPPGGSRVARGTTVELIFELCVQ